MKGLIMAGGEGTRLRPITCTKPKPMVQILGRPVMEYIIELMKNSGISDIAITLMYMPHEIIDHFGDGSDFGVNLTYFIEDTPLGTAGSVKAAQDFLNDTFIIISGDSLTDIDISDAINFHHQKNAEASIVLKSVENPLEYGIVITDSDNKIIRFLEKPNWSEVFSDTANTGIYILNPSVLDLIPPNERYDFSKDLFPKMLSSGNQMYGYAADGYWCDIGDLSAYKQCQFDILDKKVNIDTKITENNGVFMRKNIQCHPGSTIVGPCYIGNDVTISGNARILPYSLIGDNCIISGGASIKKSIVSNNVTIGKHAQIRGAIIGQGACIGAHTTAFEGSVVGSRSHIGDMCEIKNNIKIWPQKNIKDETIISDNLIWGDNFSRKLFGENGVLGEINVDVTPEFATRLGAAFGVANKKSKIAVSGGGEGAHEMLRSAFISGLLSSGAGVYDFGEIPLPVARRAVLFHGLGGGMHILLSEKNSELNLSLTLLNSGGGNILRLQERKIEAMFMREDFTRCKPDKISSITKLYDFKHYYIREILNEMNAPFNIKVKLEGSSIAKEMLVQLGASVVELETKGAIAAAIDSYAERLILTDEKGRLLSPATYAALMAQISAENGYKIIISPISHSDIIEKIAVKNNAAAIRCKTGKADIMDCMQKHNAMQFRLMFDAIYAISKLCDTLVNKQMQLCDVVDTIPKIHIIEKEVSCDISKKGKVIRQIADMAQKGRYNKIELEEGVKIINNDGWVLIIPHSQRPVCKVISEGINEEYAAELCDLFAGHVEKFSK